MDYEVVNGMGGTPSMPVRAHAPIQNYVVSSRGATFVPQPVVVGLVDYTGPHRIVNRWGVTGAGGGGGPTLPTYGQIFPSGR